MSFRIQDVMYAPVNDEATTPGSMNDHALQSSGITPNRFYRGLLNIRSYKPTTTP
jgi:hypothetical protein